MVHSQRILLIIGGGIAAYKSLILIRHLRRSGVEVKSILTKGGEAFVTPLSISSLSGEKTYQDLFSLTDELEMGHIELSRWADMIVVCPATADLMAKAANGLASDLASTALLATNKPVLMVPAMNVRMWTHPATQRNITRLREDGVNILEPDTGAMACGEFGPGRLPEPEHIHATIMAHLDGAQSTPQKLSEALKGKHILITAGPTQEPLDPVRYLSNHSSGKQGYAIAEAASAQGATVTLVSGPVNLPPPPKVKHIRVQTAREMLAACEEALPSDVFIGVAAIADWRPAETAPQKLKLKDNNKAKAPPPPLKLVENPDILKTIANHPTKRPGLVIGFAAETDSLMANAKAKLARKKCDWIVANDVSGDVMGGERNAATLLSKSRAVSWPTAQKSEIAHRLISAILDHISPHERERLETKFHDD